MELWEFDIQFQSQQVVKGQVLTDFLIEGKIIAVKEASQTETWILYVDGWSTISKGGVEIFLQEPNNIEFKVALKLDFEVTNNETKYESISLW